MTEPLDIAAGAALEAEGAAIIKALAMADALASFIVQSAMAQHVPHPVISFDPHAAARIAHMACEYRDVRAGTAPPEAQS